MSVNGAFSEENYYDRILQKISTSLPIETKDKEIQEYVADELISLMNDLISESSETGSDDTPTIANIIVLMLSIFENKDSSIEYKAFADLNAKEQARIRELLKPTIEEHFFELDTE